MKTTSKIAIALVAALTLGIAGYLTRPVQNPTPPTVYDEQPEDSAFETSVDSLIEYMKSDRQCSSSTNGCFVCGRNDDDLIQCSTAITACVPREPECTLKR